MENKLEIFIITYNRANDLDRSLKIILDSSFANCKLTILDNCSTDDTPRVCAKYHNLFKDLNILRHQKNIGAAANYLHAVELSQKEYTWILCDDDQLDFSHVTDIEKTINSGCYDLILVGMPSLSDMKHGIETTAKDLNRKIKYYYTLSFVPSIIFKTDQYDSKCIQKGYENIATLYPQFVFINKTVQKDFSIYISKNVLVKRSTHNPPVFSNLSWLIIWIECCSMIKDKCIRKKATYELTSDLKMISMMKTILYFVGQEKINKHKDIGRKILSLSLSLISSFGISKELLIAIFSLNSYLIPTYIYHGIIKRKVNLN